MKSNSVWSITVHLKEASTDPLITTYSFRLTVICDTCPNIPAAISTGDPTTGITSGSAGNTPHGLAASITKIDDQAEVTVVFSEDVLVPSGYAGFGASVLGIKLKLGDS